jgi:FAD/FMN-containing dehydrogenase
MREEITQLNPSIKGTVILPEDDNYNEARAIYNAMIDKKPSIIVKCKDEEDVIDTVNFARKNNLEVSIRSGGHNGAGLALVEHGLVIDLSEMKNLEVDPKSKTAVIGPGNTLKDIDAATHEFGLALPSGIIGTTGIGGITLGGGLGYLSRKGGLTIDNLLECKVVLASGELVTANLETNSDLFGRFAAVGGTLE